MTVMKATLDQLAPTPRESDKDLRPVTTEV